LIVKYGDVGLSKYVGVWAHAHRFHHLLVKQVFRVERSGTIYSGSFATSTPGANFQLTSTRCCYARNPGGSCDVGATEIFASPLVFWADLLALHLWTIYAV